MAGDGLPHLACQFLIHGRSHGERCEGLTRRAYYDRIVPLVVSLQDSSDTDIRALVETIPLNEPPDHNLTVNGVNPGDPEAVVRAAGVEWYERGNTDRVTGRSLELDGEMIARVGDPAVRLVQRLGPGIEDAYEELSWRDYRVLPYELVISLECGRITEFALCQPDLPFWEEVP